MIDDDQRRRALAFANERRTQQRLLKEALQARRITIADAVLDEHADTMMVGALLMCAPGWGEMTVRKALGHLAAETQGPHEIKLWPWSLVGELQHHQRVALRTYLTLYLWRRGQLLECSPAIRGGATFEPAREPASKPAPVPSVDARVISDWIRREFPGCSINQIERRLGLNDGALRRWCRGDQQRVTLTVLDRAFTSIGRPDLLNEVFPL
jgi:hypothetical protein